MATELHSNNALPAPVADRTLIREIGADGEAVAASMLLTAFGAEIRWGSRMEDNRKMDVFISYEHPWHNSERIVLLSQIKAGSSFGRVHTNGIKFYKTTLEKVKRPINDIFLVWFNPDDQQCYWAYVHPNNKTKNYSYGKNHKLTPSIRFEAARIITRNHTFYEKGASWLILNLRASVLSLKDLRKERHSFYNNINVVQNPLLGNIEFTELGWKHMFRASRHRRYKQQSLSLIPYLKHILRCQPTAYWINKFKESKRKDYEFRQYHYVFSYADVKSNTGDERYNIIIKVIEEIGYPLCWKSETLLSQKILRRVVFQSCSLKEM